MTMGNDLDRLSRENERLHLLLETAIQILTTASETALEQKARAERAEAELARKTEALRPFADVADHDIGLDEADSDTFRPMTNHNSAAKITVGNMRAARSALEEKTDV